MTTQLHVCHLYDMYAVTIRDNTIVRVEKFLGDIQLPREVEFLELPVDVQNLIITKLMENGEDT